MNLILAQAVNDESVMLIRRYSTRHVGRCPLNNTLRSTGGAAAIAVATILILPILSPDRRVSCFVENKRLGSGAATDELLCHRVPGSSASSRSGRRAGKNLEVHQRPQGHTNADNRDTHPL